MPPPLPSRKPRPPQPVKRVRSQPPVAPPPRPVVAAAPPELPSPAPPAPASAPATAASTTGGATASGSAGATGQGAGQGQGSEGAGHGVIGAGPVAGPGDDYLEALQRWLSKYKRYPAAALKKKEEGQAVVGFTLKRDGTVLSAWIVRSSGVPALDAAALELMHRASPVPPVPARYQGSELKLAIPVNYSIGFFDRMFR
ncbi:MAG TPA: TonB family protein [Stellaceae bacterium]|nr:TonB family protein [Stellaceae bacterium]